MAGKRSNLDVYVAGTAVAGPCGVGEAFFDAVARGSSGITSANRQWESRPLHADYQPVFSRYVIERYVEPVNGATIALKTGVGAALGSAPGLPFLDTLLFESRNPPRPVPIVGKDVHGEPVWFDAAGLVDDEALFPYLLPMLALAVDRCAARAGSPEAAGTELYLYDLALMHVPRVTLLAISSVFLAILDAGGRLERLERADLAGAFPPDPGDLPHYLDEFVPLFQRLLDESLRVLGYPQRTIGLVVGSAAGAIDAASRCQQRFTQLGLHSSALAGAAALEVAVGDADHKVDLPQVTQRDPTNSQDGWDRGAAWTTLRGQFMQDVQQINANYTAGLLARVLGLNGEQLTVSTGCCSGATATATAARLLAGGAGDVVIACGSDVSTYTETLLAFLGYGKLAAVRDGEHERAARPYAEQALGWVQGDGSGSLVLATAETAAEIRARRAGEGGPGPAVRIVDAVVRNVASPLDNPPAKREVLDEILRDAPARPGLILGYAPGDRPGKDGMSLDLHERDNVASALRDAGLSDVRLASIKGLVGHSMGGSSAMALCVAHRVLARRQPSLSVGAWNVAHLHGVAEEDADASDETPREVRGDVPVDGVGWVVANGSGLGGTICALRLEASTDGPEEA